MKVKDLIANLERWDPEKEVFIETEDDLLDIWEVTNCKHPDGKETIIVIPLREGE